MATGTEKLHVQYADALTDHDKCRAILAAGRKAGLWQPVGLHEGAYVIMRDGQPEVLSVEEVLNLPVIDFLARHGS